MYKVFMLVAIPVLAIAWLAYYLWDRKMQAEEKKRPKQVSQRLQKTRSEMSDWAKRMAEYRPPKHKKPSEQDKQDNQA